MFSAQVCFVGGVVWVSVAYWFQRGVRVCSRRTGASRAVPPCVWCGMYQCIIARTICSTSYDSPECLCDVAYAELILSSA